MSRLSLNAKLLMVVMLFTLAAAGIAARGVYGLAGLHDITNDLVKVQFERRSHWVEIRDRLRVLSYREVTYVSEDEPEKAAKLQTELDSVYESVHAELAIYMGVADPEGQAKAGEFAGLLDQWFNVDQRVREAKNAGRVQEAFHIAEKEGQAARDTLENFIQSMFKMNDERMQASIQAADDDYASGRNFMIIWSIVSVLFGFAFATWVLRQVSASISKVIEQLSMNSDQVTGAAQSIASSSDSLSQAATTQAASLQETAASIEELNQMVQRNLEGARRAAELSGESYSSANKGKEVVGEMTRAIGEIDSSNAEIMARVEESNRRIAEITTVITEIGNKTKVINDIVFQTKLLSFNASVEAARAGEHGKGFAVVAEEVGNLAQMSGTAAKEISTMLDESVKKVDGIVSETRSQVEGLIRVGKEKVEVGTRIAEECAEVLNDIVGKVSEVSQMSQNIAHSSEEQAQGVDQITKAMHQLDQVTQTNAGAAEQAASSAEQLKGQAISLKDIVHTLVASVQGERAARMNGATPAPMAEKPVVVKKSFSEFDAKPVQKPAKKAEAKVEKPVEKKKKNIIPFKKEKKAEKKAAPPPPVKVEKAAPAPAPDAKASGGDLAAVPAENDPRFKDI